MVNPALLRTFLAVCETGSFTAAARQLGMTQPGVSQHVKTLEEFYGQRLIRREGGFEVTESGDRLREYARRLFSEHEAFRSRLGDDSPTAGDCRLASPGSFGMKMYGFLLEEARRHPELAIHYAYAPNVTVMRDVLDDRIDGGFVTLEPREAELTWEAIDRERWRVVVPADVTGEDFATLRELGFISHPDGPHYADRVLRANFPREYRSLRDIPLRGTINTITRILEPVAMGMGFTVLPEYACEAFPERAKLRYFPLRREVEETVYWVRKRARALPSRYGFLIDRFRAANAHNARLSDA